MGLAFSGLKCEKAWRLHSHMEAVQILSPGRHALKQTWQQPDRRCCHLLLPWPRQSVQEQQLPRAHAHLQPDEHLHAPDGDAGLSPHVRAPRQRLQLHQAPQGAERLPRLAMNRNGLQSSEPEVYADRLWRRVRTRWPRKWAWMVAAAACSTKSSWPPFRRAAATARRRGSFRAAAATGDGKASASRAARRLRWDRTGRRVVGSTSSWRRRRRPYHRRRGRHGVAEVAPGDSARRSSKAGAGGVRPCGRGSRSGAGARRCVVGATNRGKEERARI